MRITGSFQAEKKISPNAQVLCLESINVHFAPQINSGNEIKMLYPIAIYSTLSTVNSKKKTYYYSPFEKELPQLIDKNLRKGNG